MSLEIIMQANEFSKMESIKLNQANDFKDSFKHYLLEIVEVIEKLKSKGIYCYNSTVEENCQHLNLDKEVLSRFVYNSQSYLHNKIAFEQVEKHKNDYKNWIEPEEKTLKELSKNKTYVTVVGLGKQPFKARPFFDAEGILFWIKPRFSKQGYRLNLAKYSLI